MHPEGERLEPLGASDDKKEDERDFLQTSLFSLTTHLAQVQFRLKQIVDAPFDEQEELLKSLEEFAFGDVNFLNENIIDDALVETMLKRRNQQKILLGKLREHLNELGRFDSLVCRTDRENVERELKTQIEDLERFIQQLKNAKCVCQKNTSFKEFLYEIIEKVFTFLHILVQSWGSNCFTKRTIEVNHWHWGDLRAKLELAIIDLTKMIHCKETQHKITSVVRKNLATSIRDLMQHGTKSSHLTHSWDIIVYYYHFKKGDEYNSSTIQKLSKSFNLSIQNVSPQNNQKNLLCVIEEILSTHSRYKRSRDSHFKAFVCAGLNARRLVSWLNLIFHCGHIIETFYYPWSYVATTRFGDGLRSLDVLSGYKFELPVDFDVRKFHIEDNVFV